MKDKWSIKNDFRELGNDLAEYYEDINTEGGISRITGKFALVGIGLAAMNAGIALGIHLLTKSNPVTEASYSPVTDLAEYSSLILGALGALGVLSTIALETVPPVIKTAKILGKHALVRPVRALIKNKAS